MVLRRYCCILVNLMIIVQTSHFGIYIYPSQEFQHLKQQCESYEWACEMSLGYNTGVGRK